MQQQIAYSGYDTVRLSFPLDRRPFDASWYTDNRKTAKQEKAEKYAFVEQLDAAATPAEVSALIKARQGRPGAGHGGGRVDLQNGVKLLWRQVEGVHFECRESKYGISASVEASLPKLLNGENKAVLAPADLHRGFDAMKWAMKRFLPMAPELMTCDVARCDATRDYRLDGEVEVLAVAKVLRDYQLDGMAAVPFPTGGSLRWAAKGAGLPIYRAYGKMAEQEEKGLPAADCVGQYRIETQAHRRALEYALKNGDLSLEGLPGVVGGRLRPETLIEVPEVCTALLGPLQAALEEAIAKVKGVLGMSSVEAFEAFVKAGRANGKSVAAASQRAAHLLGYAHMIKGFGWGMLAMTRMQKYNLEKEYAAAGVRPEEVEFGAVENLFLDLSLSGRVRTGERARKLMRKLEQEEAQEAAAGASARASDVAAAGASDGS